MSIIKGRELLKANVSGGEGNRKSIPLKSSTLETVDMAVYEWLDKELDLYSNTNEGWKKIPIIWVGTERSFQIKHNKEFRDQQGAVILPVMSLERTSVEKDPSRKGVFWGNIPRSDDPRGGGSIEIARRINQEKTSNFANRDSKKRINSINGKGQKTGKIVYEIATIPMPVYVSMRYTIELQTEFQEQMNDLTQPFMTLPGGINRVVLNKDGHFFEGFIQPEFEQENNGGDMGEEERLHTTRITIEVLGRLIGEGKNGKQPEISIRQNIVDVKIPREKVMVGDLDNIKGKKFF